MLEHTNILWPFILFAVIVFSLIGIMIGLSYVLGERHNEKTTDEPYESGIPPTGDAGSVFHQAFILSLCFL